MKKLIPSVDRAGVVDVVRTGLFSGSAASLVAALEDLGIRCNVFDTLDVARHPLGITFRPLAHIEAFLLPGVSWSKTGAWGLAVRTWLRLQGAGSRNPVLAVQTASTFVPTAPYVIYTDRLAMESLLAGYHAAPRNSPGWRRAERRHVERAKRLLVMGETSRPFAERLYGLSTDAVCVVGAAANASHLPKWKAPRTPPEGNEPWRVLFVGTQWELKGGPELLEAINTLHASGRKISLTIVGCTPDLPETPYVHVVGRVPVADVADFYRAPHFMVLPTRYEAYGIAFLEALGSGMPCVGSTVNNVPQIIGDAGVVAEPGDATDLAQKMRQLMDNYRKFALRAHERSTQSQPSWQAIAAECALLLVPQASRRV